MTTSGYIVRLRDLISNSFSNLVNFNHAASILDEVKESGFTEENALHHLLDNGKSFHEAELIIATMKEWDLPMEDVAIMDFEIHGSKVWIKAD